MIHWTNIFLSIYYAMYWGHQRQQEPRPHSNNYIIGWKLFAAKESQKRCWRPEETLSASHCGEQGRLLEEVALKGWSDLDQGRWRGHFPWRERLVQEHEIWRGWGLFGSSRWSSLFCILKIIRERDKKVKVDCERSGMFPSVMGRNIGPSIRRLSSGPYS